MAGLTKPGVAVAVRVRPATGADAEVIAAIYNQGIAERQASFETAERSAAVVGTWLGSPREPLLVGEQQRGVAGFARVTRSSDRCTYVGVGEYAIYLAGWARGRGIGAELLGELARTAEELGYWKLVGKVLTTNEASAALARRCGFQRVGVHRRHARLDGEWRDVLLVERLIGEAAGD